MTDLGHVIQYSSSKIQQIPGQHRIFSIDMHTCGEPLRVITGGYPEIIGNSILEKRRYAAEKLDHLRTSLMLEPRGHADMYGCLIVPSSDPSAAFGTIFIHNEGYSTMCGHAVIALGKLARERGWVDSDNFSIEAPCGLIEVSVDFEDGQVSRTNFECVPSFVSSIDNELEIDGIGKVVFDIAYGGAFYAYLDVAQFGIDIIPDNTHEFISLGRKIKSAIIDSDLQIAHPTEKDLSFLYGTIFVGAPKEKSNHSRNVCVFADGEVDRSPTGSGVSGRLALHYNKGEIALDEEISIESILGTVFTGKVLKDLDFHGFQAVVPVVSGSSSVTGEHTFIIESTDPLSSGFLLR